jgi:hypothetical protein
VAVDSKSAKLEGSKSKDEQSAKEKATVKMVEKLFTQAKTARMPYDKDWVENYKFFRGKQWDIARPSYRHSEVVNLIHSTIQTIVPIMTDARPNIETIPENPSDFEFSQILSQILRSKWDRDQSSMVVAEAIVDACIYGTAISEQPWNQDIANGLGDFEFKTVDPFHFYPSPGSWDINHENNKYVITAIPTDIAEVKRDYPKHADKIKADLSDVEMSATSKRDMDDYQVRSATDNLSLVQGERMQNYEDPDQILLINVWMKDETLEEFEIEEKDKDGKKKKAFQTKKKYPNGRHLIVGGGVLLLDEENPYLDGKFPFARLVDHILPREFWGDGEVTQLKGPQKMINNLTSYIMDIVSLMGNPVWKNPTGSGVFSETLTNQPGLVIDHNDGFAPQRERGSEVQSSIFAALDRFKQDFEKISGVNEVTQGAEPRNASGVAIDSLREAAQTKIRLKARNVETWLTKVGQQQASRSLQFYSIPRILRITENENAVKYFKVAIDETVDEAGESQRVATVQETEEIDGKMVESAPVQYEIKSNLDVRITTGTSLPFAKAQRANRARELFQLGIYDEDDLLTDMEHPRKEKILEKLTQRKQQQAEQEAAMAQQQAIPGASAQAPTQAV